MIYFRFISLVNVFFVRRMKEIMIGRILVVWDDLPTSRLMSFFINLGLNILEAKTLRKIMQLLALDIISSTRYKMA